MRGIDGTGSTEYTESACAWEMGQPVRQAIAAQHRKDLTPTAKIAVQLRDRGDFHAFAWIGRQAAELPQKRVVLC